MKNSPFQLMMASISILAIGCAGITTQQEQIDNTIKIQSDVLKGLVQLRNQEPLKSKIRTDSVLAQQESVLISGLNSVIKSQETYLHSKTKNEEKQDENVH